MFGFFTKSHVEKATQDLAKAAQRLETAIIKETTHLLNFKATEEKVIAHTNEVQRVIKEDYERMVAAETARFESVKSKISDNIVTKSEAVAKGEELLNKLKTVI